MGTVVMLAHLVLLLEHGKTSQQFSLLQRLSPFESADILGLFDSSRTDDDDQLPVRGSNAFKTWNGGKFLEKYKFYFFQPYKISL